MRRHQKIYMRHTSSLMQSLDSSPSAIHSYKEPEALVKYVTQGKRRISRLGTKLCKAVNVDLEEDKLKVIFSWPNSKVQRIVWNGEEVEECGLQLGSTAPNQIPLEFPCNFEAILLS